MQYTMTSLFPIGVIQIDLSAYYIENHAYVLLMTLLSKTFPRAQKTEKNTKGTAKPGKI
jgi:hypothetical protein